MKILNEWQKKSLLTFNTVDTNVRFSKCLKMLERHNKYSLNNTTLPVIDIKNDISRESDVMLNIYKSKAVHNIVLCTAL